MARRKKGEGSWGKKIINGQSYITFRKHYDDNYKPKDFYGRTTAEVKAKVKRYEDELKTPKSKKETAKDTLSQYIAEYIAKEKKGKGKPSSYDTLIKTLNCYITPFDIGDMQMGALSSEIISKHYDYLSKKYSLSVCKKTHSLLNMSLKYAVGKIIDKNPLTEVTPPNKKSVIKKPKEVEFLTEAQVEKLFQETQRVNTNESPINGKPGTSVYGINAYVAILIIYTGLRIGEALSLRWDEINFKENYIMVKRSGSLVTNENCGESEPKKIWVEDTPKTDEGYRFIPLCNRSIWALEKLAEFHPNHKPTDKVILSKNKKTPLASNINKSVKAMEVRCNIPTSSLHDLRHTFGSMLLESGEDIKVVSELLGHTDVTFTYNTYIHILKKQKIKAIKIFDKHGK